MKTLGATWLGSIVTPLVVVAAATACAPSEEVPRSENVGRSQHAYSNGTYQGCFTDSGSRALPAFYGTGFTVQGCIDAVRNGNHTMAGLQFHGECWGGGGLGYSQVDDSECDAPCDANPGETCGGAWRNSIYEVVPPEETPPPPSELPTVEGETHVGDDADSGYTPRGCFVTEGESIQQWACTWCGCKVSYARNRCTCVLTELN